MAANRSLKILPTININKGFSGESQHSHCRLSNPTLRRYLSQSVAQTQQFGTVQETGRISAGLPTTTSHGECAGSRLLHWRVFQAKNARNAPAETEIGYAAVCRLTKNFLR